MVEFKNHEPKVVKPGECVEFPRDSMNLHGKTFYSVFYNLAWLRYEYKVSIRILRKSIIPGQPNWYHVAFADIEKGNSWLILYVRLHEFGQYIGSNIALDDDEPVEAVHIEFLSDESAEVCIYLSPIKEEK